MLDSYGKVKWVFFLFLSLMSFQSLACSQALPVDEPGFCQSFANAARCYCQSQGLPAKMCANVKLIYNRMISTFGSIDKACRYQKENSYQTCLDDWQCFLNGGVLADGRVCSGTGQSCAF